MPDKVIEVSGEFHDVLVISELRGGFPTIKIADDIDQAGLIAGDDDPFFLTLPIGKAGVTSGNKRHYDEAWLTELEKQTVANKPVGLMGHLSTADRAHAFPTEAIHWVGVLREGDTLWGKGYVPPGEARKRIQRYRAQNKKIATSIDAEADGLWDERLQAFRMDARTLKLGQIDIAPADRAGIPALAAVPFVTSEMTTTEQETTQEASVSREQVIQELRNARVTPQRGWAPSNAREVAELTAIREMLGAREDTDITQLISEMREQLDEQRKAAVKARITELVADPERGIKLAGARGIVMRLVEAEQPATVQEADTAYARVIEMVEVKELLAATLQSVAGPAAIVNGRVRETKAPVLVDTPETREAAMSTMGIQI